MEYLTKENIIIICLVLIIIYIILDKFYKKPKKEHFTEEDILNKISSIINGEDTITFKNVYITDNLTAPTLYTRHILADKDKTHKTIDDNKNIDGNDYVDFKNNASFYNTLKYKNMIKF